MSVLGRLFGESPFGALKEHSRLVHECVALVGELFNAVVQARQNRVREIADKIFTLETKADHTRNEIHERLMTKVLMPVGKNELFSMLEQQDSIADRAEDIAALLTYRNTELPKELLQEVGEFLNGILRNCKLAEGVFSKLDLLVEASFRGRDALTVFKIIGELQQREDETKGRKIELIRHLYQAEARISPIDLMLWTQVIERMADLSKYAENSANGLRLMIEPK